MTDSRDATMEEIVSATPICAAAATCPISEAPCPGSCVFADVMRSVNIGIVVFQGRGEAIIFQNQEAGRLLGQGMRSQNAQRLWQLLTSQAQVRWRTESEETFFTPTPLRLGGRLIGYTIYGAGAFHWVFLKDITDKARMEALAEDMEYMNSIGGVFSSVRHELGNPLNSMKMTLSVLKNKLPDLAPEMIVEYAERMLAEMGRMEELLKSLKSFSMFEEVETEEVELQAFLDAERTLVLSQLESKGIALQCLVSPAAKRVRGNRRALRQVLLNLVCNAIDALEGTDAPAIAITAQHGDNYILIRVSDNGPGIPVEYQNRIFEPFFTTKEKGTGLGLVIAKKLMIKMGGGIEVESGASGTTFTLFLPGVLSD